MSISQNEETRIVKGVIATSYTWLGSSTPDVVNVKTKAGTIFQIKVRSSGDSAAYEKHGTSKHVGYVVTIRNMNKNITVYDKVSKVSWEKLGKPNTKAFVVKDTEVRNKLYNSAINWVATKMGNT
jgi:hypothetical protein